MKHVRANESFIGVGRDGSQVTIQKDRVYRSDHQAIQPTTAHFFDDLDAEDLDPSPIAKPVTTGRRLVSKA